MVPQIILLLVPFFSIWFPFLLPLHFCCVILGTLFILSALYSEGTVMHSTSTVIKQKKKFILSWVIPRILMLPVIFSFHFVLIQFYPGFGVHRGEFKVCRAQARRSLRSKQAAVSGEGWAGLCSGEAPAVCAEDAGSDSPVQHLSRGLGSGLCVCTGDKEGEAADSTDYLLILVNSPLVLVMLFAWTNL